MVQQQQHHVTLNNGRQMPLVGLGTWLLRHEDAPSAVREAIRVGYRCIDCAAIYENERQVGQGIREAIAEGLVTREELWITSKLWLTHFHEEDVERACRQTLQDLGVEYLDLYLVHWPVSLRHGATLPPRPEDFDHVPIEETWRAMERLVDQGLVRTIGVSNFGERRLRHLRQLARIQPAVGQVEAHVLLQQRPLRKYAESVGLHLTSYSTLGSTMNTERPATLPILYEMPQITEMARRIGATPAQVLLRWAIQSGFSIVPKSSNPARIRENLETLNVHLSDEDMRALEKLDCNGRTNGAMFYNGMSPEEFWA